MTELSHYTVILKVNNVMVATQNIIDIRSCNAFLCSYQPSVEVYIWQLCRHMSKDLGSYFCLRLARVNFKYTMEGIWHIQDRLSRKKQCFTNKFGVWECVCMCKFACMCVFMKHLLSWSFGCYKTVGYTCMCFHLTLVEHQNSIVT